MIDRYKLAIVLSLTLPALATPQIALTQVVPALEEVMVTARKREERLQDTPISITAISGAMIEQTKMFNVADIAQRTPNMSITASNNGVGSALQAYLRGVGQFDFALTVDPGVATYVDGIYLARTVGANIQLPDIEQILVLRGPQGILFGKNSIGGAIAVTTRRPSGEFDYNAEITAGEYDYSSLNGYLEFPITDNVAGSVAVLATYSDGWQDRDRRSNAGNEKQLVLRGHLEADITDQWNSHLVLNYTNIDQNVYPQVLSDFNADAVIPSIYNSVVLAPLGESCCATDLDDIDRSHALNEEDKDKNKNWGFSWTNTWEMDGLTLKSITGYIDMQTDSYRDADNSVVDYFSVGGKLDVQQYSQEFLLTNASGGKLDWLAGLYYLYEDGEHTSNVNVATGLYEAIGVVPLDLTLWYDRTQDTTSYAAFFNTTWHIRPDTRMNLGARYTYDEKDFDMYSIKVASQTPILLPGTTDPDACTNVIAEGDGSRVKCKNDWNEVSPAVGMEYDFDEDTMGYATISSGFRSGVYNGRPTGTAQVSEADPETLISYEIGLKNQLWDDRLQMNVALFYNDYKDRQFLVNRPSGSAESALALVIDNAADSTMWGGELEFTVLPIEGLTLTGGLSYINPEYDSFDSVNPDTGELEDLSDRPFTYTPEWTANLLALYKIELDWGGNLMLRGDFSYMDDIYYSDDEQSVSFERLHADGYTIYNAGITYVTADEKWELSVFGKNLGDKRNITGGFGVDAFGNTTVSYTPPRRYFISFKFRG